MKAVLSKNKTVSLVSEVKFKIFVLGLRSINLRNLKIKFSGLLAKWTKFTGLIFGSHKFPEFWLKIFGFGIFWDSSFLFLG